MALNNSTAEVPEVKAKRTNVRWVTGHYNDEATLIELRSSFPKASWADIRTMFNSRVPPKRTRTIEAIYSKAKIILDPEASTTPLSTIGSTSRTVTSPEPQDTFQGNVFEIP